MSGESTSMSSTWSFRAAMALAMVADATQLLLLPLFSGGALSPVDDVLDLVVAAGLVRLLGWHWEFLPAFAAEIVPGLDLVPCWTLAVFNVYRKQNQKVVNEQPTNDEARVIEGEYRAS